MKKTILSLATVFAVVTASGASLEWGVDMWSDIYVTTDGSTAIAADTYTKSTADWKFVLVYLGNDTSLSIDNVSDSTVVDSFDFALYTGTINADPYNSTFYTTGTATAKDSTEITVSAGDYFGIAFFNGSRYSYIYTAENGQVGNAITSATALPSITATANVVYSYVGDGNPITVSAVPEPSTAALALAGLALLLKRRKA